jgi:Tail fiber protein gp32
MGVITASDVVLTLTQALLYPTPQQLQGFAADDVFDIPAIKSIESTMGVDGVLSAGFVFVEIPWDIVLQADSDSNKIFDRIWGQQQATKSTYQLFGSVKIPGTSTKIALNAGFLSSYKAPSAKKVMQPRRYQMIFQSMAVAPA